MHNTIPFYFVFGILQCIGNKQTKVGNRKEERKREGGRETETKRKDLFLHVLSFSLQTLPVRDMNATLSIIS